jgi:uncharacterized integral membrane protein
MTKEFPVSGKGASMPEITPSKTYLHKLNELQTEHLERRITDEEFSQRLDELNEQEAKLHESLGPVLVRQKLANVEKENELKVKEELQRKEREREAEEWAKRSADRRQRQIEEQEQRNQENRKLQEQERKEAERVGFRSGMNNYINRLENTAGQWQNLFNVLQIVLLAFSAATATMASMEVVPRWVVSLTGFIAAVAGGLLTTFKIQERIYASRKAVAEVKLETQKYDYHIEEYATLDPEPAYIKFSRNITAIQGQEMLQEVEFWNPKKEEKKEEKAAQTNLQENKEDEESKEKPEKPDQEEKLSDSESGR